MATTRRWACAVLLLGFSLTGEAADYWLRNRISRNWRTPINRPPLCRHELDDDIDYYPDAYLAEMARDGINGLWISAEGLDGLATSPKRLEKLRRTVAKCAAHGIKIWLQANDPVAVGPDDPRRSQRLRVLQRPSGRRLRGELDNRRELARLSAADSRLGWHSEAEAHLYDEAAILASLPGDAAWLSILSDTWPARARANILWPRGLDEFDNRLNLTWINGTRTGRLR